MNDGLSRRALLSSAAAAGAAASSPAFAAPTPVNPRRFRNGFKPGRFGDIYYRFIEPEKPTGKTPLLCMHASPGSGAVYQSFLPILGKDRLTIAADTPGYGLSDRPPAPPSIVDYAGAMGDLIDALGLKQVDLLGNHTSSATAIELARQRPRQVRRIVLNAALMYTPEEQADFLAKLKLAPAATYDGAASGALERWKRMRTSRPDLTEEEAWRFFWESSRDMPHANWGYAASYAYNFATAFAQIRQPVLIVNPDDVLRIPSSRAKGVGPNIRVLDVPWTSGIFAGHAAEFAALTRDFLDSPSA